MLQIEKSTLWRSAFPTKKRSGRNIDRLKTSLFTTREKVSLLVSQIPEDLPRVTVHYNTHLDALWETASLIAGNTFKLTPAEAYVLGCAILLHDAGMSVASYPAGIADV